MPKKKTPRMTAIQPRVAAAFFDSGRLNAGTALEIASTPVRATAPDENARMRAKSVTPVASLPCSVKWSSCSWLTGRRCSSPEKRLPQPPQDEQAEDPHVDVGGDGEDLARFLESPEVAHRHEDDEGQAELDPVLGQRLDGRGDGEHAGRDRHRHGQHVVDEEGGAGHQRRGLAEILPADDVRAPAARVGEDRLPVAEHHDGQQQHHDDRDRDQIAEGAHPRLRHQHVEDLLRGVRGGGDRVRREDRQRDELDEPLVVLLRTAQRAAHEESFEDGVHGGPTVPAGATSCARPRRRRTPGRRPARPAWRRRGRGRPGPGAAGALRRRRRRPHRC